MITRLYVLHALSPLHAGTGQGVGLIDLPIARERSTEHPIVPGSSLKGVLRDAAEGADAANVHRYFGSPDAGEGAASMVRVSDARVLAFPVRSDKGTFAWVTSPFVLLRLLRDAGAAVGYTAAQVPAVADGKAITADNNAVVDRTVVTLDGLPYDRVAPQTAAPVFEALGKAVFSATDEASVAWRQFFVTRLVIVSDDRFTWLVNHATDVRAHVRIGDSGTVEKGALWYQETLPSETILAGLIQVAAVRRGDAPSDAFSLLGRLTELPLQVGGNATTGAGRVRLAFVGGGA